MNSKTGKLRKVLRNALLVSLLAGSHNLMAQGGIGGGVKAGAAISYFSANQPHTGVRAGTTAGIFGNYGINEKLSLQLEANYLQQGGSFVRYFDENALQTEGILYYASATSSNITLHNIEIPLLAQYELTGGEGFSAKLFAGPSYARTIAAWEKYERSGTLRATGLLGTASGEENVTSEYQSGQFGAVAGMAFEVPMGDKAIVVDLRYRYGISTAKKGFSHVNLKDAENDLRTHTATVTLGYRIF